MPRTINEWQADVWNLMEEKGFHDGRTNSRDDVLVRLALIHTEVSEATQEVKRHWVGEGSEQVRANTGRELGDAIVRILDLTGGLGLDTESILEQIHAANARRPHKYGTPDAASA